MSVIVTNGVDTKGNISVVSVQDKLTTLNVQPTPTEVGLATPFEVTVAQGSDYSCTLEATLETGAVQTSEVILPQTNPFTMNYVFNAAGSHVVNVSCWNHVSITSAVVAVEVCFL